MKSPYCFLCHKDCRCAAFYLNEGGGYVRFVDYLPLPDGAAGHPRGFEWFCPVHLLPAKELAFKMSSEALLDLQREFGVFPEPQFYGPACLPELWLLSPGPNLHKIAGLVRQATGDSPAKFKEKLVSGAFKIAAGHPSELKSITSALETAGATFDFRCP